MSKNSGQALLIIVLVMIVGLTVSLSVAARSIVNLRISSEEANSEKAFQAAEAGVEQVLKTNLPITSAVTLDNGATIASVSAQLIASPTQLLLNNGALIQQTDGGDIWLSDYSTNPAKIYLNPWTGGLTIYWGSTTDNCSLTPPKAAAVEIALITGPKATPKITRYGIDPCGNRNNNFLSAGGGTTINGVTLPYSYHFSSNTITNGLLIRVIPLYLGSIVGLKVDNGSPSFPPQGKVIAAKGQAGTTQRLISYFQGYDALPSEFFYSLFSQP